MGILRCPYVPIPATTERRTMVTLSDHILEREWEKIVEKSLPQFACK
jgi:acyl carrier protein phosphodiesterase